MEIAYHHLGKSSSEKVLEVRNEMSKLGAQALVVSALDEVACKLLLFLTIYDQSVETLILSNSKGV